MNPLHEIREAENALYALEHPSRLGEAYDAVKELVEAASNVRGAASIADWTRLDAILARFGAAP